MRRLIAITHVSMDGVMQSPGGPEEDSSNGFAHGGWTVAFRDAAGAKTIGDIVAGDFDMLLGRRTYDIFASFWPQNDDHPIGKAFNRATKFVASRSETPLAWEPVRRLSGDIVQEVREVTAADGPDIHIWGSSQLLQTLIGADLIDEHRIWVFPVVLGQGKRLFEPGVPARRFELVASQPTATGVIINTYRRTGQALP